MKKSLTPLFWILGMGMVSCNFSISTPSDPKPPSLEGSWKLLSGWTIQGNDSIFTDYTLGEETLKIRNKSHFSFVRHDLNGGQDSTAIYISGAGRYDWNGEEYTEHLDFCNFREWEGHTFEFKLTFKGDTLIQTGLENIEELDIEQIIVEKYLKVSRN